MFGIIAHSRHNLARRPILEIINGKTLQGMEHVLPKVEHDSLFQGVIESDSKTVEEIFECVGEQKPHESPRQEGNILSLDHIINNDLNQPWRDEVTDSRKSGTGKGKDNKRSVGTKIADNAKEGPHWKLINNLLPSSRVLKKATSGVPCLRRASFAEVATEAESGFAFMRCTASTRKCAGERTFLNSPFQENKK